jgi:hypothetical protein
MSILKVLVDAAAHSEYGKVIICDFKPGLVERSIDLGKELSSRDNCLNYRTVNEIFGTAVAVAIHL